MNRELGGPQNLSGALEIWKTSCICHETNHNSLAIRPVASSPNYDTQIAQIYQHFRGPFYHIQTHI